MTTMNDNKYLKHYGVLGMRWGHRKGSAASAKTAKKKNRNKVSEVNSNSTGVRMGRAAVKGLLRTSSLAAATLAGTTILTNKGDDMGSFVAFAAGMVATGATAVKSVVDIIGAAIIKD